MLYKASKNAIITLVIIASVFVAITLFCTMLQDYSMCGNYDFNEVDSPSKNYTAIAYTRDCGVITSPFTHIEIRWKLGGIISKKVVSFDGESSVEFHWQNDEELLIEASQTPLVTENYKPFGITVKVKQKD
jgi:Family of unknown function (DUF5412)